MFLTRDGNPRAAILLASGANWIESHAAGELRKYVKAISGAELPVVAAVGGTQAVVAVGRPETNPLVADLRRQGLIDLSEDSPGLDGFVIQSVTMPACEVLVLGGSQDRGTLFAVYALLEDVLGVGFFRDGERVPDLPTIRLAGLNIRERPRFAGREEGSGCMFLYSAMCWSWEDWKRELDWRAKRRANVTYPFFTLNGLVVCDVMRDWGIPCEAPALTGYAHLHEQALDYARKLGIRVPCNVPLAPVSQDLLRKFPDARTITSDWAGFAPTRTLHPADPLFRRFVVDFVKRYSERYGNDHLYDASFLSEARLLEGGDRHQAWLAYAKAMSEALLEADPDAVWLVNTWPMDMDASVPGQGWTVEQVHEYLDAITVPMIVDDLWAEEAEKYRRTNYFGGKRWGFGVLHSFGGNTYMHGDVRDLVERTHEIDRTPAGENCVWFSEMSEIIDFTGFYLEIAARLAWNPGGVTVENYVARYCRLRYGDEGGRVFESVFTLLIDSVYGPNSGSVRLILDPLYWFRLPPDLHIGWPKDREETLALRRARVAYIPRLRQALAILASHWDALEGNDMAARDLVDIARQWIAERFEVEIRRALDAFRKGDSLAFERSAAASLGLLNQQARLLASWPPYRLQVKVERAKAIYGNDSCRAVKHAHVWVYPEKGMESPDLRDYYRMHLDALVREYYRPRVAAYLDVLRKKLAAGEATLTTEELDGPYSEIEEAFLAAPLPPQPEPESVIAVVREFLAADGAACADPA